jgi:recombinational DNA repair protein RecR
LKAYIELEKLAKSFERLPGVGKKTALRYAYAILEKYSDEVISYYDFAYFLKENVEEDAEGFVLAGTKHPI